MTRSREVSKGATRNEFVYTATSQQTTFSGNDDSSNSLAYTAGQIDVFVNGVRQSAADYTATNGTSVVLGAGASAGDTVNINAFGTFSVADVIVDRLEFDYTATAGQTTFTGSDNDSQTMAYTAGRIDVYLNGSHLNQTDDYVATNGTSVVLQAGAEVGDILHVVAHGTVNLASNILSGDLDLAGNELILDADNDTTITADTDDQIDIKIAGADDFAFKANKFEVQTGSNIDMNGTELILDADGDTSITADTDDQIDIRVGGTDVGKFDSTGLEVTSASAPCDLTIKCPNNTGNSSIFFGDTDDIDVGIIEYGHSANDMGFYTNTNRHMLIRSNGRFDMGIGSHSDGAKLTLSYASTTEQGIRCADTVTSGTHTQIQFLRGGTQVGKIECANQSSTAYVTTSDYRMKENVDYSWDATTRLKQLKPARFNFKEEFDSDKTTVDGFIAHEVSSIVPESIAGTKDATKTITNVVKNASGDVIGENIKEADWTAGKAADPQLYPSNSTWSASATVPDYQGIDQAKLVPLLVKTVQELEARIKTLEDA